MTTSGEENEMKQWLKTLLKEENLAEFSVQIIGNSGKGDGYSSDVSFVYVNGLTNERIPKDYNLVVKSSKQSETFRENFPVKEIFANEIYFYNCVYPSFVKFQKEKNIEEPFDNVPKCYGTLIGDNFEVLALENLKILGYELWDRKKALTRKHVDIIIENYAKLHAISVAMQDQKPQQFKQLATGLNDGFAKVMGTPGMVESFVQATEEVYDLWKSELDLAVVNKWKKLAEESFVFMTQIIEGKLEGLKVIIHGDSWGNNFMHSYTNNIPSKTILLDWQIVRLSSPIIDLATFLFTCIAEEDIDDLETILLSYYNSLSDFVNQLGSDLAKFYRLDQFLSDWQKYGKYGLTSASIIHKFCLSKEDLPDMAKTAESGADVGRAFSVTIKDTTAFKSRMRYIVEYAAKNNLI